MLFLFKSLDHTGSVSLLVSQEKGIENLKMQEHKVKESWWTKGLTGWYQTALWCLHKSVGFSYSHHSVRFTITIKYSQKSYLCGKFAQNLNIMRTRQNKNYFSLMLRISYLPRNAMNVLQLHSKKYFFYQATSRARTVLWARDMGAFFYK